MGDREDVYFSRISKESCRVVFHRIIILRGAVIGVHWAVGSRSTVRRTGAQLYVFLVVVPGNAGFIELLQEVGRVIAVPKDHGVAIGSEMTDQACRVIIERIAVGGAGIGI